MPLVSESHAVHFGNIMPLLAELTCRWSGICRTVEQIPLENNTIDIVICVGSVLNYTDAQKTISEFGRILAPGGILILEFERSNSSEFLFTRNYAKTVFQNRYIYNNQIHFLWLYNEKHIAKLARFYGLKIIKRHRFHCLSTLMYRLGVAEEVAAKYCSLDKLLQPLSYPIAHNVILFFKKTITDEFS